MDDVPDGQLYYLSTFRAWNLVDLQNAGRNMPRGRVLAYVAPDALDQRVVQGQPLPQAHEQDDPLVPFPLLPDRDTLDDLRQLLDLAVDLSRPDPHAARVQHGVRSAVDDHAVVRGQLDVIAMRPRAGEPLEIGGPIAASIRVVPEATRHRGKRQRA